MATDATGTPTSLGIPKINTAVDAPSGKGINAIADAVDTLLLDARKTIVKKAGVSVGTRRGINLIEGSNVTLTISDDSGNDEVDVTIAAAVPTGYTHPAGAIEMYGGSSAPTGWLLCDGTAVSRATYAALFTAISTAYGTGDGSTTFNVPDFRGRTAFGKGTNTNVDALGENDGITVVQRQPYHKHTVVVTDPGHTHSLGSGSGVVAVTPGAGTYQYTSESNNGLNSITTTGSATTGITVTAGVTASGVTDMVPFLVVNYIIKT